ncbi:hypothetical protein [Amphibacillus cookii]|uniref:hypothetical protein n=1 Tax=Amphibacillus cookii TaxID=767787 RepID=UPI001957D760|nr:hypothetical protein [Amphibacillus cookii]MBM7543219.1 hypothetical protein [Amphibacillus cookii]
MEVKVYRLFEKINYSICNPYQIKLGCRLVAIQLAIVYLDFSHHKYQDWNQALAAYHRGMSGMESYITDKWYSRKSRQIQTKAEQHHTIAMAN